MKSGLFLAAVVLAIVFKNVRSGGEQSPDEIEASVNFYGDQVAGYLFTAKNIEAEISNEYKDRAAQVSGCSSLIKNVTDPETDGIKKTLNDLKNVFSNPPKLPEINITGEASFSRKKRQINVVCLVVNDQYQKISATLTALRTFKANMQGDYKTLEKSVNETLGFLIFFKALLPGLGGQLLADVANSVNLTLTTKIDPKIAYLDKVILITSDLIGILTKLYTKWCFSSPYALSTSDCTKVGDIYSNKSYCFVQKAYTWVEAYDYCYYRGMNLYTITDLTSQYEISKVAKVVASATAKLWINGQALSDKWFTFMPYPVATSKSVEWTGVVAPSSGCLQIVGATDAAGSFSADSGDCNYRYWSFCEYRKPAAAATLPGK
jgi:hypothetical protein